MHDVGDYTDDLGKPVSLKRGNVLTIEPGIYISPSEFIPKEFWGIGVRIEDDVAVTDIGHDVLSSKAPKEIADLEKIIGTWNEK